MSRLAFLTATCWLDEDGLHVWTAHDCGGRRNTTMLPYPTWSAVGNQVTPSIHCLDCEAHYMGTITEPEVAR